MFDFWTLTVCVTSQAVGLCQPLAVDIYQTSDDCEAARVLYISFPATSWAECKPMATATKDFEVKP